VKNCFEQLFVTETGAVSAATPAKRRLELKNGDKIRLNKANMMDKPNDSADGIAHENDE
jgi:hypothetical protein